MLSFHSLFVLCNWLFLPTYKAYLISCWSFAIWIEFLKKSFWTLVPSLIELLTFHTCYQQLIQIHKTYINISMHLSVVCVYAYSNVCLLHHTSNSGRHLIVVDPSFLTVNHQKLLCVWFCIWLWAISHVQQFWAYLRERHNKQCQKIYWGQTTC